MPPGTQVNTHAHTHTLKSLSTGLFEGREPMLLHARFSCLRGLLKGYLDLDELVSSLLSRVAFVLRFFMWLGRFMRQL
eukprot:4000631-Amphidinium_carterae.1